MTSKLLGLTSEMKGMKLSLEKMAAAHLFLGEPAFSYDVIHVAGTNGKGSVATKIAAGLQESGKKVGLFTSPHMSSVNERIVINGKAIENIDQLLERILPLNVSYFETLTLAAFVAFSESLVDVAVVETGMGGRMDATNVVKPILSVITSISFDHKQWLGETLEAIATEKAGIIKKGVPVVLGPHAKPKHVFAQKKEQILQVEGSFEDYELENQAIAAKALNYLGITPSQKALEQRPRCRFEKRGNVILDIGHNMAGLQALFRRIKGRPIVIAAFSIDKEIDEMVAFLKTKTDHLYLTQAKHERAYNFNAPSIDETIRQVYKPDEQLVICGTVFMMDEALISLKNVQKGLFHFLHDE